MASSASSVQELEIEQLKAAYPGKVKVISNIGDFTYVVSVQPAEFDLQLKFQLTDTNPATAPTISIKSSVLSPEQTKALTSKLSEECSSASDGPVMMDLVTSCNSWLLDNRIGTSETSETKNEEHETKPTANKYKRKNKSKKEKRKTSGEECPQNDKKPPMKTALDVIKRLQWDEAVDKHHFIVGYMDRLVGLVERAFVDFTWEDLASVDHFALAIPQHRIQYFKYKEEKVWDKNERLDNVFGSTGSKMTIVEAVEKYEAKSKQKQNADAEEDHNKSNEGAGLVDCDSSEKTGEESEAKEKSDVEKAQGTDSLEADMEKNDSQEEAVTCSKGKDPTPAVEIDQRFEKKGKRNYFVALQITDRGILDNLRRVQLELESRYPKYGPYWNYENGMHLTLNALTLNNIEELQKCVLAMNKIKEKLTELAEQAKPVVFRGLSCFNTKVVFAKVNCPPELREISRLIMDTMVGEGLSTERKRLNPHLTLFHVGKSDEWEEFDLDLSRYRKFHFGQQNISNIQVCQMGTLPDMTEGHTGFYTSIFCLKIDK